MIQILEETTKYPLQKIGRYAGVCWHSPDDVEKNIKRAKECIESWHGRVLEFVDIELVISGYSARVIREWYTHIAGSPTRLQESTRYCEWSENTPIVLPDSVIEAIRIDVKEYEKFCRSFYDWIEYLKDKDVPKEDIAMFYPLGMETKIVDKRNLRNLVEMSHQRLCNRAYWEYRMLMNEIIHELRKLSDEWEWICDKLLVPKCKFFGKCTEKNGCKRNGTEKVCE